MRRSTIGAEEFNGRVRDGIGFGLLAIATRPAKQRFVVLFHALLSGVYECPRAEVIEAFCIDDRVIVDHGLDQAERAISTG